MNLAELGPPRAAVGCLAYRGIVRARALRWSLRRGRKEMNRVAPTLWYRYLISSTDPAKRSTMNRSAESHVQLASGGRDDLRQLFELSFSEPARDDEDLRHAVLDYVRTAKAERRTPEMVIVSLKRAISDAAARS